jgi:DNA adenine methylase
LNSPLKWHGGKHYLAEEIVALMPEHVHYVEVYAGGLSVLLARPLGMSEVVNDIDGRLMNFWRVLQDDRSYYEFVRIINAVPFAEPMWEAMAQVVEDAIMETSPVRHAVAFFIRVRQSLAARQDAWAALSKTRTRRGMNEQASAWWSAVEGLPQVHERLKRVVILNKPALEVIEQQDGPTTLFYLDPPYWGDERTSKDVYKFEMDEHDHTMMLKTAMLCHGKVVISGYRSQLYDNSLAKWRRVEFDVPNNAAGGETKARKIECVWMNY